MKKITTLVAAILFSAGVNAQFFEGFDDITLLNGWNFVNVSEIIGTGTWFQGNPDVFPAQSGDPTSYIGVNFNSGAATGVLSDWMILPTLQVSDGDEVSFITRTVAGSAFPDRLEVRLSTEGNASVDPVDFEDVGSYTILLGTVNENLETGGYPEDWTLVTYTISGIGNAVDSRIAFRYFVTDGGPSGANSNFIGVDSVDVTQILSTGDNQINGFSYFFDQQTQNLTINASEILSNINIFNVLGQQVVDRSLSSNNEVINLSTLKAGVYIANAVANGKQTTFKIVKR